MSETATEPQSTDATVDDQGNPEPSLGDAGKQALDRMKAERNAAKAEATKLQEQLAAINQANETALEKAQREATEAREAATKSASDALRFRVAAKHGISDEDADLFLTGSDEETLQKQAARLVDRTPTTATPKPDLTQGGAGAAPVALNSNDLTEALKSAVGAN